MSYTMKRIPAKTYATNDELVAGIKEFLGSDFTFASSLSPSWAISYDLIKSENDNGGTLRACIVLNSTMPRLAGLIGTVNPYEFFRVTTGFPTSATYAVAFIPAIHGRYGVMPGLMMCPVGCEGFVYNGVQYHSAIPTSSNGNSSISDVLFFYEVITE